MAYSHCLGESEFFIEPSETADCRHCLPNVSRGSRKCVSQFSRHTLITELHLRIAITSIAERADRCNGDEIISSGRSFLYRVSGEHIKYIREEKINKIESIYGYKKIYTRQGSSYIAAALSMNNGIKPRQTPASIHASRGHKAVIHEATRPRDWREARS